MMDLQIDCFPIVLLAWNSVLILLKTYFEIDVVHLFFYKLINGRDLINQAFLSQYSVVKDVFFFNKRLYIGTIQSLRLFLNCNRNQLNGFISYYLIISIGFNRKTRNYITINALL